MPAAEAVGPVTSCRSPFFPPRKLDLTTLMGKSSPCLRASPKASHIRRRAATILVLTTARTWVLGVEGSYPAS